MSKADFIGQWQPDNFEKPSLGGGGITSTTKEMPNYITPSFPAIEAGAPYGQVGTRVIGRRKTYDPLAWGHVRTYDGVTRRFRRFVDSGEVGPIQDQFGNNIGTEMADLAIEYSLEWNEGDQTADVITDDNDGTPANTSAEIIDEGADFAVYETDDFGYVSRRDWYDEITEDDLPEEVTAEDLTAAEMSQVLRQKLWLDNSDDSSGWSQINVGNNASTAFSAPGAYKFRIGAFVPRPLEGATLMAKFDLVEFLETPTEGALSYSDEVTGDGGTDEFGFIETSDLLFDSIGWQRVFGSNVGYETTNIGASYGQLRVDLIDTPARTLTGSLQVKLDRTTDGHPPDSVADGTVTLNLDAGGKSEIIEYEAERREPYEEEYDEETEELIPPDTEDGEGEYSVFYSNPRLIIDGEESEGATFAFRARRRTPVVALGFDDSGSVYRKRTQAYEGTDASGEVTASEDIRVIAGPFAQGINIPRRVLTEKWEEHHLEAYVVSSHDQELTDDTFSGALVAEVADAFTGMTGQHGSRRVFRPVLYYF